MEKGGAVANDDAEIYTDERFSWAAYNAAKGREHGMRQPSTKGRKVKSPKRPKPEVLEDIEEIPFSGNLDDLPPDEEGLERVKLPVGPL